jgi:hypothetical protein
MRTNPSASTAGIEWVSVRGMTSHPEVQLLLMEDLHVLWRQIQLLISDAKYTENPASPSELGS